MPIANLLIRRLFAQENYVYAAMSTVVLRFGWERAFEANPLIVSAARGLVCIAEPPLNAQSRFPSNEPNWHV